MQNEIKKSYTFRIFEGDHDRARLIMSMLKDIIVESLFFEGSKVFYVSPETLTICPDVPENRTPSTYDFLVSGNELTDAASELLETNEPTIDIIGISISLIEKDLLYSTAGKLAASLVKALGKVAPNASFIVIADDGHYYTPIEKRILIQEMPNHEIMANGNRVAVSFTSLNFTKYDQDKNQLLSELLKSWQERPLPVQTANR